MGVEPRPAPAPGGIGLAVGPGRGSSPRGRQVLGPPRPNLDHPPGWIQGSVARWGVASCPPTTTRHPQPLTGVVGLLVGQDLHHLLLPEGLRPGHRLWKGN